jgi:asparagine synthase (glutamine-hydrolysing)
MVLGHRRLSIIDLSAAAAQPMTCARTGSVVTFNGEIYNYRELREDLAAEGWSFATSSDTEVALAAYGKWGLACFEKFNGMFALAIYDPRARTLVLARDRVGKKPLYYAAHADSFAFASELKGLLECLPGLPRDVDPEALKAYADLGYVPSPLAIFRGVRKLPAATVAVLDLSSNSLELKRYWRLPPPDARMRGVQEAAEELDPLLRDSVKLRLRADVPLGVFLSGGVDSSLIAALCAKETPDLLALTVKFADAAYDESAIAADVARWIDLPHVVVQAQPSSTADLLALARQFDEPFADSSLIPTYLVSREARQRVKVVLSGDGGDELFAGYDSYHRVLRESYVDNVPVPVRQVASVIGALFPVGIPGKNFLRRIALDPLERFLQSGREPEPMDGSILAPRLARDLALMVEDGHRRAVLEDLAQEAPALSLVQTMTRLDFLSYLPDDVLVKVDRASMLASLEVRSPLLDFRVVELAFRMPDELRYGRGVRKAVLKELAKRYLPPTFPYERKRGFAIPVSEWFNESWASLASDAIAADSRLVDRARVAELQERNRRTGRYGKKLFEALMLGLFESAYART